MPEAVPPQLAAWNSFYVVIGSSAAALTGLMFVAISLMPDRRRQDPDSPAALAAFATPTVLHYCGALLISALMLAPFGGLGQAGLAVAIAGTAGVLYGVIVVRRLSRSVRYKPVMEDWIWHTILPLTSYAAVGLGGWLLETHATGALFGIGAGTLVLLFIGIHNAWDTVSFLALEYSRHPPKPPQRHSR